ncbi:MAG: hypothetical protein K2N65_00645, partial [Anaeroplasmataceae bacterium]|nr:hypothetical protein [Anaeroplasmataceae bacterium]
ILKQIEEYMNQDFNVQNVMTLIEQMIKDLNVSIRMKNIEATTKIWHTLNKILSILGINLFVQPMKDNELEVYINWSIARQNKDFEAADTYRQQLADWGIL